MDFFTTNKNAWNNKVAYHLKSEMYRLPAFLNGASSLMPIEIAMLGDITGKRILHLQCHFGQDSISLSRMGAKVTAVDFSDVAIEEAMKLAVKTQQDTQFVCCNVYDLKQVLNEKFDIVYTSYGVIGWLPDLQLWADIISHFLQPNGKLIMVEFHPVLWMFDDKIETIAHNYFNEKPIIETQTGTYADKNAPISQEYVNWNHSLSEVVNSLIKSGLMIESLDEYDYSPYNILHNGIEFEPNKFRPKHIGNKMPILYAIQAVKK